MSFNKFILTLLLTTLLSFATHYILCFVIPVQPYWGLTLISVSLMVSLSIIAYFLALKAVKSDQRGSFINLIILNIMLKLFLSFALVLLYAKFTAPSNKLFVIPFLAVYLYFTIFETYFLSKQSREAK